MTAQTKAGLIALAVGLVMAPRGHAPRSLARPAAGEVAGTVYFKGEKPKLPEISMAQDPVCASEQTGPVYPVDGAVNSNGTLPDVFIYAKQGLGGDSFKPPSTPVTLLQQGCEYRPHVLGIMVGQPLQVTSQDPTTHNIHVLPKLNHSWNVSQEPGSAPLVRKFSIPEIMIPVKCNQHPWMKAYIGVTTNPFYSVTGSDGTFSIKGLPPGDYTIAAWTATFGSQEQKVTVPASGSTTVDFTFKVP